MLCRPSQQSAGEGLQPAGAQRQPTGGAAESVEGLEHHPAVL